MSTVLSLLGLTTRGDVRELAALQRRWNGVFDLDRSRAGLKAYYLLETREPITARTPAALGAAMASARRARTGRAASW